MPSASLSRRYGAKLLSRHARKWVAKFIAASSMKTISTASIATESKYPMFASWVENPPSAMAENAWHTASNQFMPASFSAAMQASVMPKYISHRFLAVSVMRGVSLASFIGPGVSALYTCMPPTPSIGRIATASTMMPMPPSQLSRCRHKLIACGKPSRPDSTVAPLVVSPDMVSK